METGNLKGCRIVIKYDTSGVIIADTTIVAHDQSFDLIFVPEDEVVLMDEKEKISALVLGHNGPFDCILNYKEGNESTSKFIAFRIIEPVEVEHRKSERYQVIIPSIVKRVEIQDTGNIKTKNQFLVTILNMSATGFLIRAPKAQFDVGDVIEVQSTQQKANFLARAQIVRIQNPGNLNEEVAGKFISVKNI